MTVGTVPLVFAWFGGFLVGILVWDYLKPDMINEHLDAMRENLLLVQELNAAKVVLARHDLLDEWRTVRPATVDDHDGGDEA